MAQFASEKIAVGDCDRCGQTFPLKELKFQVIRMKTTNLRVCSACLDIDHPQYKLGMLKVFDPQALQDPRPADNADRALTLVTPPSIIATGTAQAGAAKSLTLAAGADETPDYYARGVSLISITSGTGVGQTRGVKTSRKNLVRYSQSFDNAAWLRQSMLTAPVPNAGIAPDGTNTACLITYAADHFSQCYQSLAAFNANGTLSVWARTLSGIKLFTLITYNPTQGEQRSANFTATTTWQKFSFTPPIPNTITSNVYLSNNSIPGVAGTMLAWGYQAELGSVATEYIHTEANAAVGVAVDNAWSTIPDATSQYVIEYTPYTPGDLLYT